MNALYDAGVLIAADSSDRKAWAEHRARLELGIVPLTTAPVVAQVSRSSRQAQLRRFLRGCEIVAFTRDIAHEVGALLGAAGKQDVVDSHLVLVAHQNDATVFTSDVGDLRTLADRLSPKPRIARI